MRRLSCFSLLSSSKPQAVPWAASELGKKPKLAPAPQDRLENAAPLGPPDAAPPAEHGLTAYTALQEIASTNLGDPGISDYRRTQLMLTALDNCVPFLARGRAELDDVRDLLGAFKSVAMPAESAGMLATVCQAASVVAMQTPGRVWRGGADKTNAALFNAVADLLYELPSMAPFRRLLDAGRDAAGAALEDGKAAIQDSMFDTYMGLLTDTEPCPPLVEIAFLQQALIVLAAVDVAAAYRVRHPRPLTPAPVANQATQLEEEDATWVNMVHSQIARFAKYMGGSSMAAGLRYAIEAALSHAPSEPRILQVMFRPSPWPFQKVRQSPSAQSPRLGIDLQSNLLGAMYQAVLHHINGRPSKKWHKRGRRAIAVNSHQDFFSHVFCNLHNGVMSMPQGWIPARQLEELHAVAQCGVAQDCDAYTLRARLQAYASTAAASPTLASLAPNVASKIADAWETFKRRLRDEDAPLQLPT